MTKLIMKISIIVAIAGKNRVIGRKGEMPWNLPPELKRFKEITTGHPVIMGRKTFESIGRVLPNRTNIIITRDSNYSVDGGIVVGSLDEALEVGKKEEQKRHPELARPERGRRDSGSINEMPKQVRHDDNEEIFIIGGGQIYQEAINIADKLYLTYIDREIDGDTFFPDYSDFKKVVFEEQHEENDLKYKFLDLER